MKITNNFEKNIFNKLIFIFMGISFLLSIKQFFPFNSFDEIEIMDWIRDIDHNPAFAFKYPPLFVYMNLLLSKIYSIALSFLGFINTDSNFLDSKFGYSFTLEVGRIVNAFLSSVIVFVTYKIGKNFFNQYVGLFAALLIAVNPLIILYSHIFKPGILTALLVTTTLYFLFKYIKEHKTVSIFWASVFCGLSISAKFNVFPLIISIYFAIYFAYLDGKKMEFKKLILFIPSGGIIGFSLGAPNWVLNPIGNIKAFLSTYSPDKGNIFELFPTKTMTTIWVEFFDDIKTHFGLIIFVLFILAIIYSILKIDKQNIFIILFIFFYVLIISYFGFFADRMSMPVFPAVSILVGKFLLFDIPLIFKNFYKTNLDRDRLFNKIFLLFLFPVSIYAAIQINDNTKTYNLLKTQTDFNYTIEYREQHNIDNKTHKYNIGRQIYTPRVNDRNIKITKKFQLKNKRRHKNKKLHFIQAHGPTYTTLTTGKLYPELKKLDMSEYRPFYMIKKREYQPWNPECIYLYKVAPDLLKIVPKGLSPKIDIPKNILIPKVFYKSQNTSFLPLQVYEQNPNFGITKKGLYSHWIYSKKKIKELKFDFIRPKAIHSTSLSLVVNNSKKTFKVGNIVKTIILDDLKPKFFYFDYIYQIEIKNNNSWKQKTFDETYFTFDPVFEIIADNHKKSTKIQEVSLSLSEKPYIPELFSNKPTPDWIKNYYSKFGVDLTLLKFVGTGYLKLYKEKQESILKTDFFPLVCGTYRLFINWENIDQESLILEIVLYTSKGKNTSNLKLLRENNNSILLKTNIKTGFFKLFIKPTSDNYDIKLNWISIAPDLNGLKLD